MQSSSLLVLAIASVSLLSVTAAQDVAASRRAGPRFDMARGRCAVVELDGVLRAFGQHYKARFDDGVVFTPALGDAAPRNQDLAYRLESICRGETPVAVATAGVRAVALPDRDEVRYARSAGIVEHFTAAPEGLEVSYSFAERPAGHGDLVVSAAIATELQPRARDDGTLLFELPGTGGVTIGAVTGIDADGDRVSGALAFADGCLSMTLPAAFVDGARYPIVLDPLLGVEFQIGVTDDSESDVGYQHTLGFYLVAWKQRYSSFDHDINARFFDSNGNPQGGVVFVDVNVDVAQRPRIGSVPTSTQLVIVYEKAASPFGPFHLVARTVTATGAIGPLTPVAGPVGNPRHHAVGSEITNADDEVVVAYRTDAGIEVREITVPPVGGVSVSPPVQVFASNNAFEPEISRSGGLLGYWMVVWRTDLPGDAELFAAVIDRSLVVRAPALQFTANTVHDGHPAVDGDGSTFVVAYQQGEPGNSALHDIRGARLQFTGSAVVVQALDVPIETTPGQDEHSPHTTWLGPKHCVVFVEQNAGLDTDVGAWLVDDTCVPCHDKIVLDGINVSAADIREFAPRVGGRWQFALNGVYDDGFITFTEALDVPMFTGSIICQRVEALGPGTAAVTVGPGCGNGGTASIGGGSPFVIGSQHSGFYVNGLEATAIPFLTIALPVPPLTCGGCTLTNPFTFTFKPNVGGSASSPFPVTCNTVFVGLTIEFQWVSFQTSQNPCPLAAGLSASDRMRITIGN